VLQPAHPLLAFLVGAEMYSPTMGMSRNRGESARFQTDFTHEGYTGRDRPERHRGDQVEREAVTPSGVAG
jgi:hypothetical protein